MSKVIVVGGGVMGLMLSRLLLREGCSVTLIEAGQCGQEASWAGGGIISPLYPWRYSEPVTRLAAGAQQRYPALCRELFEETGIDPELTVTGMLMLDAEDAEQALAWSAAMGVCTEAVASMALRDIEPQLGAFDRGLWMPHIANVRNPRLLQALLASVQRSPRFSLLSLQTVVALGSAWVATAQAQRYEADQVVVCAGAWSGELLAQAGIALPVTPVKGEMLLYRQPVGWLKTMVMHQGRYAIPRRDGHIVVGSTLEHCGFDKTPRQAQSLQQSAQRLLPALAACEPVRHWAGLRPGSPEGVPYMGELPTLPGVYVCAGHFRNGLVLSPASCELMRDLLLGREPDIDPVPYALVT